MQEWEQKLRDEWDNCVRGLDGKRNREYARTMAPLIFQSLGCDPELTLDRKLAIAAEIGAVLDQAIIGRRHIDDCVYDIRSCFSN